MKTQIENTEEITNIVKKLITEELENSIQGKPFNSSISSGAIGNNRFFKIRNELTSGLTKVSIEKKSRIVHITIEKNAQTTSFFKIKAGISVAEIKLILNSAILPSLSISLGY
jgi:hypothetical protein